MNAPSFPGLECLALEAGYASRPVLRGVSLALRPGQLTAVIGPNGSGKSTLLRCLSGSLRPTRGKVLLDGAPLAALRLRDRARRIAVLPQSPATESSLALRAAEVVLLGRYARLPRFGPIPVADRQAAEAALAAVEALPLADRPLRELSGGEMQRVFLARALAQEADILLLDEPSGAMDPAHQTALFRLLAVRARRGAAVAAVLHDVNAAALFCDRVVALRAGEILFDEPPSRLHSRQLEALYDTTFHLVLHPAAGVPQFCQDRPDPVPALPCPGSG